MSLDLTPEQKQTGQGNFQRVVGKLAAADQEGAARGVTRRRFMQGMLAVGAVAPIGAAAYFGYQRPALDRPVRAALIGAGDEGGVLVGEHNPRAVQFVAYSDIRPSNRDRIFEDERLAKPASPRKGFKFHYGNDCRKDIRYFERYQDLLADSSLGVEMVVIAVPLNVHAAIAIDCLRAGKHVLCEKLMAWNIRQCKDMIREAARAERLLAIGHQRHYSMLYAHANEVVQSGVLGDVRHIRALWHRNNARELPAAQRTADRRYRDSWRPAIAEVDRQALGGRDLRPYGFDNLNQLVRWRLYHKTGGGLMAELGSHQLDACGIFLEALRHAGGGDHADRVRPLAVSAVGGKYFYHDDREVEDHVYCTYEYPGKDYNPRQPAHDNDVVVVTYSSINTNGFEPYGECVMGSKGTLIVASEQAAYLYGNGPRSTEVTATAGGAGPVLDASSSTAPTEQLARATGAASLGSGPPSRGYREEMEHFAWCIRQRDEGMERDRERSRPRCDGEKAMADAIVALTANRALRERRRIEFQRDWFDPNAEAVPDVRA